MAIEFDNAENMELVKGSHRWPMGLSIFGWTIYEKRQYRITRRAHYRNQRLNLKVILYPGFKWDGPTYISVDHWRKNGWLYASPPHDAMYIGPRSNQYQNGLFRVVNYQGEEIKDYTRVQADQFFFDALDEAGVNPRNSGVGEQLVQMLGHESWNPR